MDFASSDGSRGPKLEVLAPRPVDLRGFVAQHGPFFEGIVEAMSAKRGAGWVQRRVLAPSQLKVFYCAHCRRRRGSRFVRCPSLKYRRLVRRLTFAWIRCRTHYRRTISLIDFLPPQITPSVSDAVCAWSILWVPENAFEETQMVSISVRQECTVGGAVAWFDADYGSGIRIHNGPQTPGYRGHLVFDWTTTRVVRSGETIQVHL